jgi:hypothetical protein
MNILYQTYQNSQEFKSNRLNFVIEKMKKTKITTQE